ncbi:hypothetical protein JZ751_019252 [Albula glossodonta]|uniref:RAS p21 protein activator 4 n=1 Tax=Albula glossodonta TaxID=121402 RepID=A0A8T2NV21_9TELE|nr:hypothetical protein JZ751_019252 [Albula glossodonta]
MAKRSTLFIRIVEAKNLPVKDITGSSDPYCIVRIDNEAIISDHLEDPVALLGRRIQRMDGWVNLTEVDPDEEVQGEIHLQIALQGDGNVPKTLRCHVFEARDLAKKDRNGASDPFVRVRYNGKTHESAVVKKSCYPRWNESFEFELDEPPGDTPLTVEVWDWDLVSKNDFLGKVLFNINGLHSEQQEEGWFRLGPEKPKHSQYDHYQPLVELLCQSVGAQLNGNWPELMMLIDETTTAESRQEVATNLVAGMQYLHRVLTPIISRIFEEKKYVELDPSKTEADVIQQSSAHLQSYLSELLHAIAQSATYCPVALCQAFRQLYLRVQERFPDKEYRKVKFIAVTSFLCLRFISPAIMSPKLLCRPLGTWIPWPAAPRSPGWFPSSQLSSRALPSSRTSSPGWSAKEGFLFLHRTKDKCMLMTSPFKKYYVTLSKDTLSYSRTQHSKKSSFISLPRIRAVEKVEEKSFGSANVMQIISSEDSGHMETLYLDCKSVNELNQWLSALRKACSHNTETMNSYHPGVYKGDKWSCCHQKDKTDTGCDKTRHGVTLQEWYDPLDPDLESQLIYRHLLGVRQAMRDKYLDMIKPEGGNGRECTAGQEKLEGVTRFFKVLDDLQDAHSVVEEAERSRNKNFLLELQT